VVEEEVAGAVVEEEVAEEEVAGAQEEVAGAEVAGEEEEVAGRRRWRPLVEVDHRVAHDQNLPQSELFSRSKMVFCCLKGRGPLKKVQHNAEM
jgi:hypothetical protein